MFYQTGNLFRIYASETMQAEIDSIFRRKNF